MAIGADLWRYNEFVRGSYCKRTKVSATVRDGLPPSAHSSLASGLEHLRNDMMQKTIDEEELKTKYGKRKVNYHEMPNVGKVQR